MSFLEKVQTSRSDMLYLVRGKADGIPCWHYILVDKQKLPMFKIRVKTNQIELADYGQILESGWGENPSEEIQAKIKQQFS